MVGVCARIRLSAHALGASALVATMFVAVPAFAQSDEDRATARAAATSGAQALEDGRFEEAIALFQRAEGIIHAPPHWLYIARAQAKLGHLVSAREMYVKITRETLGPDAPRAFTEAQSAATAEAKALEARIPTVTVEVDGAPPAADVVLTIDGTAVPPASIGLPRPIDPGRHALRASTPTATSELTTVDVAEGAKVSVKLVLEPVANVASEPPPATSPSSRGSRAPALIALGVGVVGVAVGTVFVLNNHAKRGDADALCPGGACPTSSRSAVEDFDAEANAAATMAWVGYGVGAAGLATGAILWLLNRDNSSAEAHRLTPTIGFGAAGIGGQF